MKKLICICMIIGSFSACQNTEEKNGENKTVQQADAQTEKILEIPYSAVYNEQTQKLEMKPAGQSKLNMAEMIGALNNKYPEIKLEFVSIKMDTAYVRINDAKYLTQTIGSSGAQVYFAEATFALTDIKGVKAVNFAFPEGDHAAPGTYTRENFNKLNL